MQAVQTLLAAVDYDDPVLMSTSVTVLFEACRGIFRDTIQKIIGTSERMTKACHEIHDMLAGDPRESIDEVRTHIESFIDQTLKKLVDLSSGPVRSLQERGYDIDSRPQLEHEIAEMRNPKSRFLDSWPQAVNELPPVNREMVAASRAAIARGDRGEPIADLIRRMGGAPDVVP